MLKFLTLILNTVALLIYQFFFAEGVTVTQNLPSSANAESEFTVELTINKGSTSGFAKLQQDLPAGFTAIEGTNTGASFTFSNQSVKFIWMSLPGDKEFKISYKVKVAGDVNGDKVIGGKFSYVLDNVKQSIDIPNATIKIIGTGAPAVTETAPTTPASKSETSPFTCTRKIPEAASTDFVVEITVNKGNLSGFAKLLETLPPGFTATAIETQQAAFTFADQKAKFVWVSLPSVPEFKISYKINVVPGTTGVQNIDGVFSYIENDETKKFILPANSITIGEGAVSQPLATTTTKDSEKAPITTEAPIKTETPTTTETAVTTTASTKEKTTKTETDEKPLSATTIPSPQGKVNYRVQIAALHNSKEPSVLASLYKIKEQIITEMAEGFTKYTVGSHNEYKSARDAREDIKNNGVVGPFVTAYNIGKRITVQEALMVTNQKWYR